MLQGYNATIFAYGQTGTGKTHTMLGGSGENRGVIPRAAQQILQHVQSDTGHTYIVQVAFLQLYMEMLQDLLDPSSESPIRIREDPEEGVYLSGIRWVPINSVKECMDLMALGDRHRNTAFTSMNSHSSRSHAAFMIKLEKRVKYSREQLEQLEAAGDLPDQSLIKSVLYLVDLAGSERVKKSKAVGNRLDEAKNINLALLALGNCIQALADKKAKFVPFRDSKLTRLLEDSLGGNSKTSLIVTIGPSANHTNETISALQFGSRAMKVENRPEVNKIVDYRALCSQLQVELDQINDGNSEYIIRSQQLAQEVEDLRAQVERLTSDKEELVAVLEDAKRQLESKGNVDIAAIDAQKKQDLQRVQQHYQAKLQKQDEEHRKFMEEIDTLILDQERDSAQMKAQIVQQKNEKAKLAKELSRLQGELERETNDRDSRIAQITQELEELRGKLSSAEEELLTQKAINAKVAASLQEREGNLKALSAQLEGMRKAGSEEAQGLRQQLQSSVEEQKKLKQAVLEKKRDLEEKARLITEELGRKWKAKFEEFQSESAHRFATKEAEKKELENQLEAASKSLSDRDNSLLSLRTDTDSKSRELLKLVSLSEALKSELDKVMKSLESLNKQHTEAKAALSSKDSEYTDLMRRCVQREEEVEDYLRQVRDRDLKLAKMGVEIQTAAHTSETVKRQLEEQIAQIRAKHETETSDLVRNFADKINKLHSEGQKQLLEIEQLEKKHRIEVESLELCQSTEINELKSKFEAEKRSLSSEYRKKTEEMEERHREDLAEAQARANSDTASLKRQFHMLSRDSDSKVEDLKEELARQRTAYMAEIEGLNRQHQETVVQVKSQQRGELEAVRTDFGAQLNAAKGKFEAKSQDLMRKHGEEIEELKRLHALQIQSYEDSLDRYKSESAAKLEALEGEISRKDQLHAENSRNSLEEIKKLQALHRAETAQSDKLRSQLDSDSKSFKAQIAELQAELKVLRKRELELISKQQEELAFMHQAHTQSAQELESRHAAETENLEKYWKAQVASMQDLHSMETERTTNIHGQMVAGLNRKVEAAVKEKEDTREKAKADEQRREEMIASLKQSQQGLFETVSELEKRLEEEKGMHETQAVYLQGNLESLSQKLHLERERATAFECQVDVLRMESVQSRSEISDLAQQLSQATQQCTALQQAHEDELREESDLSAAREHTLEQGSSDYQRAMAWYLVQALVTEVELREALGGLEEAQRSFESGQKADFERIKALEDCMKTAEGSFRSQRTDLERAIAALAKEREECVQQLKVLEQQLRGKEIELKGLEVQLDSTRDTSLTQSAELSGRLKELQKTITSKDLELLSLHSDLGSTKERLQSLSKKLTEETLRSEVAVKAKDSELVALTLELEKLKEANAAQIMKATERLTQLQQSVRAKDSELSQMALSGKRSEENANSQGEELAAVRKQLAACEGENRQITVKIRALEQASESFRQEKVKQLSELHLQLSDKEKTLKERDSSLRNLQSELQSLKSASQATDSFLHSHLSEDFDLLSWLKAFLRDHKKSQVSGHFEFLSYLCNVYHKLQAKGADTVQVFEFSRLVHDKFFEHTRSQVSSNSKVTRYFETSLERLEKEMEIVRPAAEVTGSLRDISLRQQEAMKKKLKKAGRAQRDAVLSTMEHLVLVTELQEQGQIKAFKEVLEARRRHCEAIFTWEQLKTCSLVRLSGPEDPAATGILSQVLSLKRLALHLTALLCISSSVYSCLLAKR